MGETGSGFDRRCGSGGTLRPEMPRGEDLAGYKKPRQVAFVEELPRNALGKVLEHRVREGLNEPEE